GLTDEETVQEIRENPYLQYFLGYPDYCYRQCCDPSLLVTIRRRLGPDLIAQFNRQFLAAQDPPPAEEPAQEPPDPDDDPGSGRALPPAAPPKSPPVQDSAADTEASDASPDLQGQLLIDATVAPADIRYPTDLDLLNQCREVSEALIDTLWEPGEGRVKPRTYRRVARQEYLAVAKQRKKHGKQVRQAVRKQLQYVKRNLGHLDQLLDATPGRAIPLSRADYRNMLVIREVYRQQQTMYDHRTHRMPGRIVSVSQPHVRPIVRGKARASTEFGAKLSVSLVDGYAYLDRISWEAYNESQDLSEQVERFREQFGHYPAVVIADAIYGTRANRRYLKQRGIRFSGKPLGRPPADAQERKAARQRRQQEAKQRNRIEGKFGEGKRKYQLGRVRTKRQDTSEHWIAMTFFAMNIAAVLRHYFLSWVFWCLSRGFAVQCTIVYGFTRNTQSGRRLFQ
nr:IS5 family transposase [Nitrospinaceae bacterium]